MIKQLLLKDGTRIFTDILHHDKYNVTVKNSLCILNEGIDYIIKPYYDYTNKRIFELNINQIEMVYNVRDENLPYVKFLMRCIKDNEFMFVAKEDLLLH